MVYAKTSSPMMLTSNYHGWGQTVQYFLLSLASRDHSAISDNRYYAQV